MVKEDYTELMNRQQASVRSTTSRSGTSGRLNNNGPCKFADQHQLDLESKWIKRNRIQCRQCIRFVPEKYLETGVEICACGYPKSEHNTSLPPLTESPVGWNQKNDTEAIPTDAYGEIEFVGFGQRYAKYVRVDVDSSTDTMWQLMRQAWKLTPPNLVISVTGGAKNFHMIPKLKDVFRKGLVKAALSTDAWITSSGTNAGVMKYVGEAVRDLVMGQGAQNRVVALGIAPWGCVQNKHVLRQTGGTAAYRISEEGVAGETNLDNNHSHFILVDDGTQHKFSVEIPFRAKMEKTISEKSSRQTGAKAKVPIILVVLEGGPGTLQTVHNSIQERTPAVIIAGSGRAANILAYAIQNSNEHVFEESRHQGETIMSKALVMNSQLEKEVKEMLRDQFREKNDKKLNEQVEWVRQCLTFPELLTVYQLDSSHTVKDIDLAMLQALLKANQEQVMEQLKLAMIWNRVDVAKRDIFTEDRTFKAGSLDDIMYSAILKNRVDFVQLFLENGLCLGDFLTVERLQNLYQSAPKKTILYEQLKKSKKSRSQGTISLHQVGHLIQSLMGDFYKPVYLKMAEVDFVDSGQTRLERPARDLFIWSILMGRCDMARVFWEEGRHSMPAALVAYSLLKSMRQRTSDNEIKQKLHWDALKFQELAIGILRECHLDDVERTMKLLIGPLYHWGNTNCVSIAIESGNKEFIAHSACQELFSTIWWGNLATDNGLQILPCVLCPPLALGLRYRQDKTEQSNGTTPAWPSRDESVTSLRSNTDLTQLIDRYSVFEKMTSFFIAPVTKFCYTVAFFLIFLMLYSYVMLIDLRWRVSAAEVLLIFWVFTMAMEEFRQLWKSSPGPFWHRTANYLSDKWNILDVVTIGLFTLGMVLRCFPTDKTFSAARAVLAINLFTFFLRLLHIFSASKVMGPKLVMIGRMLKDLATFMLIMLVFIVGYGITSQSILYPNTDLNKMLVIDVIKKAYWQIFAELFLEEIEGKEECVPDMAAYTNGTHVRCPSEVGKVLVPILLAFYMLYMHILMLSLLIAVFTNTFEAVQSNTGLHWHFQRYKLVYEYYERPSLPPPFIIFSHIYRIVQFFKAGCETNVVYGFLSDSGDWDVVDSRSLELFEENKRDEYMWQRKQGKMKTTDYRVATTSHRVESLVSKVEDIREHMSNGDQVSAWNGGDSSKSVSHVKSYNRRSMSDQITSLETQVRQMQTSLHELTRALVDNKLVPPIPTSIPSVSIEEFDKEKETDADGGTTPEIGKIRYYRQTTSVETRDLVTLKSRLSPYPGSSVNRLEVPDNKTAWEDPFPSYSPVEYTSDEVKEQPPWADEPLDGTVQHTWNSVDETTGVNKVSYQGEYTVDDNGYPLNPIGRTGLLGQGCLGRWGPNHAADPIVTRWKQDGSGDLVKSEGKPVLEFVAVRRHDNKHWALPWGFLHAGESVDDAVRRRFVEEAMAGENVVGSPSLQAVQNLLSESTEIYRGYVDDERNTDNAWIETVALNYHDEDGSLTKNLKLRAGKTEDAVAWLPVWSKIPMQSNHCFILERVAELRDAAL